MNQFLKKRWVYHSLIWVISYLIFTSISFFSQGNSDSFISCLKEPLILFIPLIPATYLGFWAKEVFFDNRRYLLYGLATIAAIAIGIAIFETIQVLDESINNSRTQNLSLIHI